MDENNLEKIIVNHNRLKASSIGLPMIPTVIVGSVAMGLGQDYTSEYTNNLHGIVAAGMSANIIIRNPTYFISHLVFNRKRLFKNRKLDWNRTVQDSVSFFASSKIGYFVWAGSCFTTSQYLMHDGYSPLQAGMGAGIVTGSAYALFMSTVTPKIDWIVDYTKKVVKKVKCNFVKK